VERPSATRPLTAIASLRQLLDSLSREQHRNQELLSSLGFALRSFTNLGRFLELVPLVASRLVEAEGAVLVTLHPDGRLWREQLHANPADPAAAELLRRLGVSGKAVLVDVAPDDKMARSVRNIPGVVMVASAKLTARAVADALRVVATKGALEKLQGALE